MLDEARSAAARAYAPYSSFRVGAVAVTATGKRFAGANVENAAYPSTLCAEASAIGAAISSGERAITTMAVISLDTTGVVPCGQCRQRMSEFGVAWVILESDGGTEVVPFSELLPRSFEYWDRI